jgi:hypothetical protein
MAASPPQPSPSLSSNAHFSSLYTNGHLPAKPRPSDVPSIFRPNKAYPASIASTPEVQINGRPRQSRPSTSSASTHTHDETTWGSHFWVTLVDPQTQVSFFACPATGQVSWDPPVGNFVYVLMQPFLGFFPHGDTAMQITAQREWRMVGDW